MGEGGKDYGIGSMRKKGMDELGPVPVKKIEKTPGGGRLWDR